MAHGDAARAPAQSTHAHMRPANAAAEGAAHAPLHAPMASWPMEIKETRLRGGGQATKAAIGEGAPDEFCGWSLKELGDGGYLPTPCWKPATKQRSQ